MAKFPGIGRNGATESGAHLAKIRVVWGGLGFSDLEIDVPGCGPFETAHYFPFALALRGAFGHVVLGSLARCHADQDNLIQGRVGVAIAASAEPVTGGWLPEDAGMGATVTRSWFATSVPTPGRSQSIGA